jgi:transglutaminase-like putative cysteine protease
VAVAPKLPGAGEKPLLDTRNREGSVTEFVSPMIDIKSKLVNKGNVELFAYAGTTERYLQVSAMSNFNGRTWTATAEDLLPASDGLAQAQPNAETFTQQFVIKKLGGKLLPAAATATSVAWEGDHGLRYAPAAAAIFVDGGVTPGITYTVSSATIDPSPDDLRSSSTDSPPSEIYFGLPDSVPDEIRTLAAEVTATATTPYDQARQLQDWFRTTFTYSLTVQRGHSNDAMIDFLRIRKGYCEQFSGTFAVMARSLGLPARTVVGYTPGKLGADGLYHVAGRHAHAWAEVWFDDFGWVLFDPTPGRGAPGAEGHTGAAPAQETGNGTPGGTAANDDTPTPSVSIPNINRGERDFEPRTPASITPRTPVNRKNADDGSARGWIVAALVLAILGWVVAMPRVLRRWSRRHPPDPSPRVTSAWAAAVRSLTMAGAPRVAGSTPLEYARSVDFGRAETIEIARLVTRAVYSPKGVDQGAADRSELLRNEVDAACRARMSVVTRLLDHLDPRSAWRRIAG